LIEDIYQFKFNPKSLQITHTQSTANINLRQFSKLGLGPPHNSKNTLSGPSIGPNNNLDDEGFNTRSLQEAAASYLVLKHKSKGKVD
jgi:hypothetical protein